VTPGTTAVPVHDSLTVVESSDIYRTDEWWKSVVQYYYQDNDSRKQTAVYLWHEDGGWARKNKYVIKTPEAWEADKAVVEEMFDRSATGEVGSEYPVSDYYTVGAGETVVKEDEWWKAVLNVVKKGSYDTDEIMIYVWKCVEDTWKRRQKHTIKKYDSWTDEKEVIESILYGQEAPTDEPTGTGAGSTSAGSTGAGSTGSGSAGTTGGLTDGLEQLGDELGQHLSDELRDT
jgi:hypothetical protein